MTNRWTWRLLLFALAGLAVVYAVCEPVKWAHYTDPVVYLSGAQSLAEGHGYRYIPYANSPKIGCHPPLQSAYLALFWKLNPHFPDNIRLLYAAMILSVAATFALFYGNALKSGMPGWVAALLLLAWGLSAAWGTLLYGFVSDILFGCLWLALAACWINTTQFDGWRRWLVTGCLLALLYLSRTAALPLILAVAGVLAWRVRKNGRWIDACVCMIPVAVAVLAWKAWAAGTPGYAEYLIIRFGETGGWAGLLQSCWNNALEYLSGQGFIHCLLPSLMDLPSHIDVAGTVWSPLLTGALMIGGWLFTACWVYGCWWKGSVVDRVGGLMVSVYLLELIVYPVNLSDRCLFAALPFVLIWAWKGRSLLWSPPLLRWIPRTRWAPVLAGVFLMLNVAANGVSFVRATTFLKECGYADEVAEIGAWLRTNTPPDTIVAAGLSEPIMHLHHASGRKVMENYFQKQPWFSPTSQSIAGERTADYLLLSWYSSMKLEESNFRSFELVSASSRSRYRLYRVGQGRRVSEGRASELQETGREAR